MLIAAVYWVHSILERILPNWLHELYNLAFTTNETLGTIKLNLAKLWRKKEAQSSQTLCSQFHRV